MGDPSPDKENYRPISITPILSKLYELRQNGGLLPAAQFAYRKGLGCMDALLAISHHLQKSLDAGMESYIIQLDFSAVFNRESHSGLLYSN